ncbi:MAG: PAS domain S-box protein [Geobacteraceae bacterium]|nr:PAS domain S-box protein [Geobacteraceae bacterium]NTW81312.1 PAS domain S-box protein [Geobacteraceae bacterium]
MRTKKPADAEKVLRQRAEKFVRKSSSITCDSLSYEEIQRSFHNLAVHQVELEMQNEELRNIQKELEISRARYRELYDRVPIGYLTIDEQGLVLESNLTAASMLAVERSKLANQPLCRYILPEDRDIFLHCYQRLVDTGKHQSCEFRMLRFDGDQLWIQMETSLGPVSEAKSQFCYAVLIDISDKKQLEHLRERELVFRKAQQIGRLGAWIFDVATNKLIWSDEIYRIFGLRRQKSAATYDELHDVVDPENRKYLLNSEYFESIQDGKDVYEIERQVICRETGQIRHVLEKCEHIRDSSGNVIRSEGIVQDVTVSKQKEEALRASEARYHSIVEDQTELIYRYLPDGIISFANRAFARYYGMKQAKIVNSKFAPNIPEKDLAIVVRCCAKISLGNPVVAFTHRIINAEGEVRWQRWTHRGIYASDGSLTEYQAVGFDITEHKLSEMIMQARMKISDCQFVDSLEQMLKNVLDEAEELTESRIGFFHFLEADQETLSLQTWSSRTLATFCTAAGEGQHYPLDRAGVWADCIREKRPIIHNSYEALPHRKGLPPGHATILRELTIPVFRNNLIVAVLGVGNKSSDYTSQDIATVQNFANLAWDIIDRNRSVLALKQARDELESKVTERTISLTLAHEQMEKISFELVWAEERERERIAGELHDRVGQSLLLAKMKLDALAESLSADASGRYAEEAAELVQTSIHDIRTLTFRMRPPVLDTAGIETSLEWLCASVREDYNLQVSFSSDCQPKPLLSQEASYSLYQAVRELLLNVVKHAKTEKARLTMETDHNSIVVTVVDNGIGINRPDSVLKQVNSGYGLYNVRLRVQQMGGSFSVESAPGNGTSATIILPMTENVTGEQEHACEQQFCLWTTTQSSVKA